MCFIVLSPGLVCAMCRTHTHTYMQHPGDKRTLRHHPPAFPRDYTVPRIWGLDAPMGLTIIVDLLSVFAVTSSLSSLEQLVLEHLSTPTSWMYLMSHSMRGEAMSPFRIPRPLCLHLNGFVLFVTSCLPACLLFRANLFATP